MDPKATFLLILLTGCFYQAACQTTIWQEDFDSYQDGITVGENNNTVNPSADWITSSCNSCIDTADWWEIRSGQLEARDVNEVVFMQSEVINISSFSNVQFSLDIAETGDHEGPYYLLDACADQDKEDYVNVLFRVNGGPWQLVKNYLSWCGLYDSCGSHTLYGDDGISSGDCRDHDDDWGYSRIDKSGLVGNTLEIRVETINSATDEFIAIDNLKVEGRIILPVTLKSFEASAANNQVRLFWQTISEVDNDYFVIERSKQGESNSWEPLQMISGAGFSDEVLNYYYEDMFPHPGRSFYRLKQVDFDGKVQYSAIETVILLLAENPYPNPAYDYLHIPINDQSIESAVIALYDNNAKEFCVPVYTDQSVLRLDLQGLPGGNYILKINDIRHRVLLCR